jgi:nuclear transport factor 2 (NTF2) superfamily protein
MSKSPSAVESLARLYTEAWSSRDPSRVAAFYSPQGSLRVNDGSPAIGRDSITEVARAFMTALPDMKVVMEGLSIDSNRAVYRWRLTGSNTGPGGSGKSVAISGFEEWLLGDDGLIVESRGHFDQEDYDRQLR